MIQKIVLACLVLVVLVGSAETAGKGQNSSSVHNKTDAAIVVNDGNKVN
jgi:hypothetical protein